MLDYFKELMKKEKPTSILSMSVATFDQLSAVTCKWERKGRFFVTQSFFTDTWISANPLGPMWELFKRYDGEIRMFDVSETIEVGSKSSCLDRRVLTDADIRGAITNMQVFAEQRLNAVLGSVKENDIVSFKLLVAPYPSLIMTVTSKKGLLGKVLILLDGTVMPCFVCDGRLQEYVDLLSQKKAAWTPKFNMLLLEG